jgi:four helix bundle protein
MAVNCSHFCVRLPTSLQIFAQLTRHVLCSAVIMAKSRDLRVRSFQFTVDVVHLCRTHLVNDPIVRRLAFQLVDSAGSVGANVEESSAGQTKRDFIAKQFVALKEARESRFWLRVISAAYPGLTPRLIAPLQESNELIAMLSASMITAKSNPERGSAPKPDVTGGMADDQR